MCLRHLFLTGQFCWLSRPFAGLDKQPPDPLKQVGGALVIGQHILRDLLGKIDAPRHEFDREKR
jgi:hypothetical protein